MAPSISVLHSMLQQLLHSVGKHLENAKIGMNWVVHPAGIYVFKFNNRNTRTKCEICSKLTIVNFEHILHLVLAFLLLILKYKCRLGRTSSEHFMYVIFYV